MTTATRSDSETSGGAPDFKSLEARLTGSLVFPGDDAYNDSRKVALLQYNRFPAAILKAATAQDVAEGVRFARENGLALAVRSGGHSVAGFSAIDGSLTIHLGGMKAVSIDAAKGTARAQAGVTTGDMMGPAHAYGFALSTGDAASVGLGGLTTGGGIGWLVRKYGLTIDSLISAEIVTADGNIVRASEDSHPDLFWAVRGGGGNFGIVTEFEFRLAPVGSVYGGLLVLPATRDIVRNYLDYAKTTPEGLTTITHVMKAPPAPFIPEDRVGELVLMMYTCWTGDMAEGEQVVDGLRALGENIADLVSEIPYPAMYNFTRALEEPHGAEVRGMFSNGISDETIDRMLAGVNSAPNPIAIVEFRPLGGAFARVPVEATAFAHRTQELMVAVIGLWGDPKDPDAEAYKGWSRSLFSDIRHEGSGVYVNFVGDEGPDRVRDAYPEATYRRLQDVKRRYDPTNFFRFNQNIKPAS